MTKPICNKYWLLTFLLSAFCVVGLDAQDNTPYPEGYLNDATRVDMSRAPNVFITKNGNEVITRAVEGRRWNRSWYWEQVRRQAPHMFDGNNNFRIDEGVSPRVNEQFLKYNPQFSKFRGEVLHHHHYLQGDIAYALPRKLHVGKGYTKLWHKFGGKALVVVGSALTIYEIGVVGNPFAESPLDLLVRTEADELELSMIEMAMTQGYVALKRYIENCRSCSQITISFVDYGELLYFLSEGELPQAVPFSQQLPKDGSDARNLLHRAVEFGIIMRKIRGIPESIGIIDLQSHDKR